MPEKKTRLLLAGLVLLLSPVTPLAQRMSNLEMPVPIASGITPVPYDPSVHRLFQPTFEQIPNLAQLKYASVVILNTSTRGVTGLRVRWTLIDPVGMESAHVSSSHSYFFSNTAVLIPPNGLLLVVPDAFLPEVVVNGFFGSPPPPKTVDKFRAARASRFDIEAIIFEDGEVVGQNALPLVISIQDRRIAADMVLKRAHDAISVGQDPAEALRTWRSGGAAWGSPVARHRSMFVRDLLTTHDFASGLRFLEQIPRPPKFFRKDGSPI